MDPFTDSFREDSNIYKKAANDIFYAFKLFYSMTTEDRIKFFGKEYEDEIFEVAPMEFIKGIEEYKAERRRRFRIGDIVVVTKPGTEEKAVITAIGDAKNNWPYSVMYMNGEHASVGDSMIEPTDQHVDLVSILQQIGGDINARNC